jgi:hypothetical protein
MTFCTDTDLLHWEPNLFNTAAFASQTLISGVGDQSGTTFTLSSGSFTAAHVESGQVLAVGGAACYPIHTVLSATQLTVSVLYAGLFPAEGAPVASAPPAGTGLSFAVRSFWAQRRVVSELLLRSVGVEPADVDATPSMLLSGATLKRLCALGTLHMIYSALAAAAAEPAALNIRADLYERLYRKALGAGRIELDTDGDGAADLVRAFCVVPLRRA